VNRVRQNQMKKQTLFYNPVQNMTVLSRPLSWHHPHAWKWWVLSWSTAGGSFLL